MEAIQRTYENTLTQKIIRDFMLMIDCRLKVLHPEDGLTEYAVRTGDGDFHAGDLEDALSVAECFAGGHENWNDAVAFLKECRV